MHWYHGTQTQGPNSIQIIMIGPGRGSKNKNNYRMVQLVSPLEFTQGKKSRGPDSSTAERERKKGREQINEGLDKT